MILSNIIDIGIVKDSPTVHKAGLRFLTLKAQNRSDKTVPKIAFKVKYNSMVQLGSSKASISVIFIKRNPGRNIIVLNNPRNPKNKVISTLTAFIFKNTL